MAAPQQSREHITLSYDPRQSEPWFIDFVRALEGILQRLELRLEALQDRVTALEEYNRQNP